MTESTLNALATASGRFKTPTAAEKIAQLEKSLGLPPGKFIFSAKRQQARLSELEQMVVARATATAPIPTGRTTSTAALFACGLQHFPSIDRRMLALDENAQRTQLASLFWVNRLAYPGCKADFAALDTSKLVRKVTDEQFTGRNRAAVATMQAIINSTLKS